MSEPSGRSDALRSARQRRMDEWFKDRAWRVAAELTFENDDLSVRAGEFWVKGGKVFRTPFGNKGEHGYILQEVNPETGADIWDSEKRVPSRAPFGWVAIRNAAGMYPGSILAVEDGKLTPRVPPRPYGQRGGVAASRDTEGGEGT